MTIQGGQDGSRPKGVSHVRESTLFLVATVSGWVVLRVFEEAITPALLLGRLFKFPPIHLWVLIGSCASIPMGLMQMLSWERTRQAPIRWVMATAAGYTILVVATHGMEFGLASRGGTTLPLFFIVGAVGAFVLGVLQSLVVSRCLLSVLCWALLTSVGYVIRLCVYQYLPHDSFAHLVISSAPLGCCQLLAMLFLRYRARPKEQ